MNCPNCNSEMYPDKDTSQCPNENCRNYVKKGNNMSDTPRTDAIAVKASTADADDYSDEFVSADFARRLERELAQADKNAQDWRREAYAQRIGCGKLFDLLKAKEAKFADARNALEMAVEMIEQLEQFAPFKSMPNRYRLDGLAILRDLLAAVQKEAAK